MKVRIKDTHPYRTIRNHIFRIEKGESKELHEDMKFDKEVFWKVNDDGEPNFPPKSMEELEAFINKHDKGVVLIELIKNADFRLEDIENMIYIEKRRSNKRGNLLGFLKGLSPNPDILVRERAKAEVQRKEAAKKVLKQVKQTLDNKDAENFLDQNTRTVLKNLREQDLTKADLALVLENEKKDRKRKKLMEKLKEMI